MEVLKGCCLPAGDCLHHRVAALILSPIGLGSLTDTLTRVARWPVLRALQARLRSRPPALVVSLAPNFNGVIRDAVRRALPGVPFLILLHLAGWSAARALPRP